MSDAEFDKAIAAAARLLRGSAAPVIAGLGADVAGIVAAFRLAEKLGAAIDHAGAEWALRDQATLQAMGLMSVSPGEARSRTDIFLVVGERPLGIWPGFLANLREESTKCRIISIGEEIPDLPRGFDVTSIEAATSKLPGLLGALRARVNGRPLAEGFARGAEVEHAADILKSATFGVALYSPEEIDTLTIEMLTGLIKDLNAATRWSGLSVTADTTATAAAMAAGWMTALPLRTSFACGRPEHDPWQYDARRLVQSGEADVVVWIAAAGVPPPTWLERTSTIVIAEPEALPSDAAIRVAVGQPGRDHPGVIYDRTTGTLVELAASAPSRQPSASDALNRIAAALDAP